MFDETYYAKDAYSLLRYGVEREFVDDADSLILKGVTDIFADKPAYVVHPPFGKWVIAAGEAVFGLNPFGWRSMMAVLGVAAVVVTHRAVLRLTGNRFTANLAAAALAIDGMAIVMSRAALLDQTLMFTVLVAFWALVCDVNQRRVTTQVSSAGGDAQPRTPSPRWVFRVVMFVSLGAAVATKWSGVWFAVAFTIVSLASELVRATPGKRLVGVARSVTWAITGVAIVVGLYLTSWVGWFITDTGWGRDAVSGPSWLPQPVRALLNYHTTTLEFHTGLTGEHDYASDPFGWLLMVRPTSFWYGTNSTGVDDCGAAKCAAEVLAIGNVVIWWTAAAAMVAFALLALLGRLRIQERSAALLPMIGVLAGWAPWLAFRERTTFSFYMVVVAPFVCMAFAQFVTMLAGMSDGGASLRPRLRHREAGAWAAVVTIVAMIAVSLFFYPLWTALPIPLHEWTMRMWFSSWI
jgi:dolichyl-phosphate-mannose-protein mannosyltransferase